MGVLRGNTPLSTMGYSDFSPDSLYNREPKRSVSRDMEVS